MGRGLRDVLAVLVTALAHDVEKQHATLAGIDHVFDSGRDDPGQRATWQVWNFHRHVGPHRHAALIQDAWRQPTLI
jgi:hypothetical protein